jgi:hypothetical protein
MGASQGGMDVDSLLATMQKVVIEEIFPPISLAISRIYGFKRVFLIRVYQSNSRKNV